MKLQKLSGGGHHCADGSCPAVYRTDRDTFVMQGKFLSKDVLDQINLASDETAVELPANVISEFIQRLA